LKEIPHLLIEVLIVSVDSPGGIKPTLERMRCGSDLDLNLLAVYYRKSKLYTPASII
jgi:hypothetical protein